MVIKEHLINLVDVKMLFCLYLLKSHYHLHIHIKFLHKNCKIFEVYIMVT